MLTNFPPSASEQLDGPDWLTDRRAAAYERLQKAPWPTSAEEVWRYSRIDELDLDRFAPAVGEPATGQIPTGVSERVDALGERSAVVVVRNGRIAYTDIKSEAADRRLYAGALADVADDEALDAVEYLDDTGAVGDLHDAFCADPVLIDVPDGYAAAAPIVIVHWIDADGLAAFPHTLVRVGDGAQATVVNIAASADVEALSVPVTQLAVGRGSNLRYLSLQELGHKCWQLTHQVARVDADSNLMSATVALGGHYGRHRIDSHLAGTGSSADMVAVYFGEGDQMHDFRTLQDHQAPKTTSNLLFKGAVEDRSHSVYSGMVHIRPDGRGSAAYQTNRNLTLSPDAWAESVPNLDIENNDVKCSHASAVGPVDEEQLFYLQSRGVPPEVAERLIVLGFFDEVIERLPIESLRPGLRTAVLEKFARRGTA